MGGRLMALNAARQTPVTDSANGWVTQPTRWGFITSKRVGNAVKRNRARRLMREAVRVLPVVDGWDVVLVASAAMVAPLVRMQAVLAELQALALHARLLKMPVPPNGASS